ncbi:MAG: DUF6242 domain-containing protein [Dysgonamonadaceae bacterium]|nr:DUF6242 domain-containing protein [Dysgonamonadaceae bacterium]
MHLKTGFYILLAALSLTGLVSCLGGAEDINYEVSTDAQLTSFAVSSDSLAALAAAKFSIDQAQNLIYNYDSLPYLTDTAKISSRAIVKYDTGSGETRSIRIEYLNGDTAWVASGDTLQMASQFYLKLYSSSGNAKTYTVTINIHQLDPDSVQYRPVSASDIPAIMPPDWTSITQNCPDYLKVVTCLGFLQPDRQKGLALIAEYQNERHFAFSKDLIEYQLGAKIPEDFPVAEFSVINDRNFAGRLTVIADLQTIWATENGLYWTNLYNTQTPLPKIKGGNAFNYNGEIWFIGGKTVAGENNRNVYYSRDGGLVWKTKESKTQTPVDFPYERARVIVDDAGKYFYVIGSVSVPSSTGYVEMDAYWWQAALNSRVFDH